MLKPEDFDPDRDFGIVRSFRFAGTDYAPGQVFPKQLCEARKLRQLYDQKLIKMTEHQYYRSPTSHFDAMSLDELRDWLASHGQTPRITWERAKLLEKAAAIEGVAA